MTDDLRRKPRRRGEKLKIAIPALIYAPFLSGATVPAEELVTQLVDEVILPLFRGGS
ncbi:hypothetical protein [Nonomuraea phyllanthi]|uniref:hypothetical protein n=1 Tax=Nonomuraea phyllanthi TaxID=2219224 RepID=UPI001292F923|nr:hypothetical protein [Nonomuraea phyllanthi]